MSIQDEKQLCDVTIVIGIVAEADDGEPYATSKVYRLDYEGTPESFEEMLLELPNVAHMSTYLSLSLDHSLSVGLQKKRS